MDEREGSDKSGQLTKFNAAQSISEGGPSGYSRHRHATCTAENVCVCVLERPGDVSGVGKPVQFLVLS